MSSTPNRRSLLGTTALAGFDASILAFIDDLRRRGEIAEGQFPKYRYAARHFLIWVELTGIALKTVDATVIDRFPAARLPLCRIVRTCPASPLAQGPHVAQTHDVHPLP